MIRYTYLRGIQPTAPFVYVAVRNPATGAEQRGVPAQLDTAADRTVIPPTLVLALALPQSRAILIGGLGDVVQTLPCYPVDVTIHDLAPQTIEAVASTGESWILLGRDVLNSHRVTLNGPELVIEIG